ncbi:MAG TPA: 3D domain-containing protein [Longimicrobiaceae bacterium]|nr:3D domain-containing protein [Longimicrobiaceae bacterium]
MFRRTVFDAPPRRGVAPSRVVPPVIALVIGAMVVGEWAAGPAARQGGRPLAAGFLDRNAALAFAFRQEPPTPQQPAPQQPPAPADTLAVATVTPSITEDMVREREARAAADAFPVSRRMDMSSTMYCLRGQMRTGVRTRDGMAAGDPAVLPLGSVVRVFRPSGQLIGIFVIMDTGGAIHGNKIDLYTPSCREAEDWGRHPVVVEVLDIGKRI